MCAPINEPRGAHSARCIYCGGLAVEQKRVERKSMADLRMRCVDCGKQFQAFLSLTDAGGKQKTRCDLGGCPVRKTCTHLDAAKNCATYRAVAVRGGRVKIV